MRPVSYAEEFINDWSAWVLEHGVPSPLHEPSVGESVPIARHVGRDIGAVLHLGWLSSDEPDDEPVLVCDVDVLVLTAEGWLSTGAGGGSGWFTPPFQRPPDIASTGVMVMGWHESAGPTWECSAVFGIAGSEIVAMLLDDEPVLVPVESPIGAFVICSDQRGSRRCWAVDRDGQRVSTFTIIS